VESGYAIYPEVFSGVEMEALSAVLDALPLERARAGARHLMRHVPVVAFANDPRLLALATPWLGVTAWPFRATLFDKSADANWLVAWHQDRSLPLRERVDAPGWGPWSEKQGVWYAHAPAAALSQVLALRIHLDESNEDNGPLRVIPGSHAGGVLTDDELSSSAERHAPVTCVIGRGGVVAMRPLIVHASSKARSDRSRRVLHIEYAASRELERGLKLQLA
jgi:hypothetical protein